MSFQGGGDPTKALTKTVTPTALQPIVQLAVNENYFGAPVYPENNYGGDTKSNSSQSFRSTKEIYKSAAKAINSITGGNQVRSGGIDLHPDAIEQD